MHILYSNSSNGKFLRQNIYMKNLGTLAWWLVIIGALNWGLVALGFNLVSMIFGTMPAIETLVYALVGLSGVYGLLQKFDIA